MTAGTHLFSLRMAQRLSRFVQKPFRAQHLCLLIDLISHLLRASRQLSSSQVTRRPRPFMKPIGYCYIHYLALGILIGCCECQSFSASAPDVGNLCCSEQPVCAHVINGDLLCMSKTTFI